MTVMTNVVLVLKDSKGNIGIVKQLTDKDIIKIADAITDVGQVVDPATHMPIEATTASVGVVQLATADDITNGTAGKVVDAKELADALANVKPGGSVEFSAAAGENINAVGTPTVTYNDGTFTFNYLKGEKGDKGDKGDTPDTANYANSAGNADTVDGTHAWQMQTLASYGNTHGPTDWLMYCQYSVDGDGYFKLCCGDRSIGTKVDRANSSSWADSAGSVSNIWIG